MRNDLAEAVQRHPSSAVAVAEAPEQAKSPYRSFLDALEELSLTISLHGTASVEAHEARAHVRNAREAAAQEWRRRELAAA